MKEKKIKAVKTWPKPKLVKEIQVFLDFVNFYRRFIKNFSNIAVLFTLILQTTKSIKVSSLSTRVNKNKYYQNKKNEAIRAGSDKKNLSPITKLKILAKSKKSNLAKPKKSDFIKANFFEMDFLTSGTKKTFI